MTHTTQQQVREFLYQTEKKLAQKHAQKRRTAPGPVGALPVEVQMEVQIPVAALGNQLQQLDAVALPPPQKATSKLA